MNVLILANSDMGLYKFRKELIETLARKHHIYICVPFGPFANDLKKLGAKLIDCPYLSRRGTNPLQDIRLYRFYIHLLNKVQPTIVFTYTIKPNIYGGMACAKLHVPYVANITGLGTAVENPGFLQKLTLSLYRYGLRRAQKVFFQNTTNQDFMLTHHAVSTPYAVLPGSGVNLGQYSALPYPKEGKTHFLFVARILKEKGIDLYLAAARKFSAPDVKFHICGPFDSPDYQTKVELAVQNKQVIYHGHQKDMTPFFEECACLLHPSWYPEGMSNVLLEAAASARPAITTNRAGCREVVEDGKTGFIVPVQDEKAFLQAVEKFLALSWEKRREIGLNARAKVEKEFNRKIVVDAYLKELEGIK